MKVLAPALAAIAILAASPVTSAGAGHGYYGHGSHHRGYAGLHRVHHRVHRHRAHARQGKYLVGGIVLGSLIANSVHRAHNHRHHSVERRVYQPTRIIRTETTTRRLLRAASGACYELFTMQDGSEIREQIAREECSW